MRGRVESRSLARYQATGTPQLTCVYDELTESTQLLGVLCAALEAIADGEGPSSLLPAPFHELGIRHDAVRLRRLFGGVAALPYREALHAGRALRLSRLDQAWAPALRLALVLLEGLELQAGRSTFRDFRAVELSAETDKIWEWIVIPALTRTDFDAVLPQGRQQLGLNSDPWISHPRVVRSNTHPDNIAFRDRSMFVVDAKYKTPKTAPSRDDQYQMFAYSHLVRAEEGETCAPVSWSTQGSWAHTYG